MKIIISVLPILLCLHGFSQILSTVKVGSEKKISLKIPDSFIRMTDEDRMKRVYSSKVPLAMFANETQEVVIGINYNSMQWTENDTEVLYGFYKASINNLFDEVEFIQDEIKEINGRKFIVFEFLGSIVNKNAVSSKTVQKSYSYIQYTSWNNQVLLFNFNCKKRRMDQWQSIAREVMNSVRIK